MKNPRLIVTNQMEDFITIQVINRMSFKEVKSSVDPDHNEQSD